MSSSKILSLIIAIISGIYFIITLSFVIYIKVEHGWGTALDYYRTTQYITPSVCFICLLLSIFCLCINNGKVDLVNGDGDDGAKNIKVSSKK